MWILTTFALLIPRHSHFCKLHSRLRYCFSAYTTLPYPALTVQPKLRFVS